MHVRVYQAAAALLPAQGRKVIDKYRHVLPQTLQLAVGHGDPLRLVQIDGDGIVGHQPLRVPQQTRPLLFVARLKNALIQRIECLRTVIPVVIGFGKITEIKRFDMADDGQIVVFLSIDLAEPLRLLHTFKCDSDTGFGQHGCNHFPTLLGVGRRRQFHGQT